MNNTYTMVLHELKKFNKKPKRGMVPFGTSIDRFFRYVKGEAMSAIYESESGGLVLSAECFSPHIDTVNDMEFLYGLIGTDRITISGGRKDRVLISIHVNNVVDQGVTVE